MLDMIDATQIVGTVPLVGKRYPVAGNAAGKVLLAFGYEPRGGFGEVSSTSLKDMETIRQQGASTDAGGLGDGVATLAVPLLAGGRKICGSLCMVGPEFRIQGDRLGRELLPALKAAGQTISTKMGYLQDFHLS
jgi:DNA-binding IclR family transcriptional regulator